MRLRTRAIPEPLHLQPEQRRGLIAQAVGLLCFGCRPGLLRRLSGLQCLLWAHMHGMARCAAGVVPLRAPQRGAFARCLCSAVRSQLLHAVQAWLLAAWLLAWVLARVPRRVRGQVGGVCVCGRGIMYDQIGRCGFCWRVCVRQCAAGG